MAGVQRLVWQTVGAAVAERNVHRREPLEPVCRHLAVERNADVDCDVRLILIVSGVEEARIKAMACLRGYVTLN